MARLRFGDQSVPRVTRVATGGGGGGNYGDSARLCGEGGAGVVIIRYPA